MSIADKLQVIAENEQRVYQAGYDKGVAEGGGEVGDDYVLQAPPKTIKTYTDTRSMGFADNAFNGYTELETVDAPNVVVLGAYAFASCNLREYKFCSRPDTPGENYTKGDVYEGAFANCKNLESVDFGYYDGIIRAKCFSGCSKLVSVILRADCVNPLMDINAFEGTPIESGNGYIYVQSKKLDSYITESGFGENSWLSFKNQFRALEDYTVDGTIHGELDETKI